MALAEHVAGSVEDFVALMNARAAELGMNATMFANPNGLDADGHYSTASDLITLGLAAIEEPRILHATSLRAVTFDPGTRDPISVTNTNRLLGSFPGVFGLKTGDTARAGRVLLAYQEFGSRRMLSVVMGTVDHYGATAQLLAYGMTALGPGDHVLAPVLGTPVEAFLPDWRIPRLEAVGAPPPGIDLITPRGSTPGHARVVAAFRDLLPPLLGGDS